MHIEPIELTRDKEIELYPIAAWCVRAAVIHTQRLETVIQGRREDIFALKISEKTSIKMHWAVNDFAADGYIFGEKFSITEDIVTIHETMTMFYSRLAQIKGKTLDKMIGLPFMPPVEIYDGEHHQDNGISEYKLGPYPKIKLSALIEDIRKEMNSGTLPTSLA